MSRLLKSFAETYAILINMQCEVILYVIPTILYFCYDTGESKNSENTVSIHLLLAYLHFLWIGYLLDHLPQKNKNQTNSIHTDMPLCLPVCHCI